METISGAWCAMVNNARSHEDLNLKLKTASYTEMLKAWLISQLTDRGLKKDVGLQHNGAPAHFALTVHDILNAHYLGFTVYTILTKNIPIMQCKHFKVMNLKFTLDTMGQPEFLTVSNEQDRKYTKLPTSYSILFYLSGPGAMESEVLKHTG
jgi:hypothetical protein